MRTSVGAVIVRELRAVRQNFRWVGPAICMPLLFGVFLTWQYAGKKVVRMPVTIVDQDHSATSRALTRAVLANEAFSLGQYADSADEFPELAARNLSRICFVFPRRLERDVKSGRGGRVAVLTDATNMLSGNIAQTEAKRVLGTFSVYADVMGTEARAQAPAPWALRTAVPVSSSFRSYFNANFNSNYANYICVGALIVPLQLASLLVACHAGAWEFTPGARPGLAAIAPSPLALILGKCFVYTTLVFPGCLIMLHFPQWFLDAPMLGSELLVAVLVVCFSFALVTFSFGISALIGQPLLTTLIGAILTLPNFLLCGYTWPNYAIAPGVHFLSYAFPMYHFAFAFRKVVLMGATVRDCTLEIGIWLMWCVLAALASWFGARRILRGDSRTEDPA
jgi:ABC-2 type transport system permease protein